MASNAGHLTKLEAVNDMLASIGESPVNSLQSGLGDAALAESILDRTSRQVQTPGWFVNTRDNYVITKNASDWFVLPDNTLKVDTVDPRKLNTQNAGTDNNQQSKPYSQNIDVVMRRSSDDTAWLLYDPINHTEVWQTPDELTVQLVEFLDFADLNPELQYYIMARAGRQFQKIAVSSTVLWEFTKESEVETRLDAEAAEAETKDENILRRSDSVRMVAARRNPLYGF